MKNNKGITLISLAITILLLFILAGLIISTSINSLEQMRFTKFKTELEEVQRRVNEISSDYSLYKKTNPNASYKEYFESRVGSSPILFKDRDDLAKDLLKAKPNLEKNKESELVFYFTESEVQTYLGLKGIKDIVVDFSTRYVYSVNGCKDPNDKSKIYYCAQDFDGQTLVSEKKYATKWELELEVSLGTDFRNGSSTVVDYVTKKAIIKLNYDKGNVSIVSSDFNYGDSKATSAAQWISRVRVSGVKIKSFNILEEMSLMELRKSNINYGDEWDLNLALSLGSEFKYGTSVVTDFITKNTIIKIHSVDNNISVDTSSDFTYGEAKTQSNSAWAVRVRIKEAEVESFNLSGEDVKVTANVDSEKLGNVLIHKVELTLSDRKEFGVNYPLEKIYYSKDNGTTWVEVKESTINGEKVNLNIYDDNGGDYQFKLVDSSGAFKISNVIRLEENYSLAVVINSSVVTDNYATLNVIAKNEKYPIKALELWANDEKIQEFSYEDLPFKKEKTFKIENMEFLKEFDCYVKVINSRGDELPSRNVTVVNENTIATIEDLEKLATEVNLGNNFKDKTINLINDLVTGAKWIPIGYYNGAGNWAGKEFAGIFEGNEHEIKITSMTSDTQYTSVGLFGMVIGGTINNLTVSGSFSRSGSYVGSVIGVLKDGKVNNCINKASISGSSAIKVGGICGMSQGSHFNNCSNTVYLAGKTSVGGIIGYSSDKNILVECKNSGNITCYGSESVTLGTAKYTWGMIGGIIGCDHNSELSKCSNTGKITVNKSTLGTTGIAGGGIVGVGFSTTVNSSKNSAEIFYETNGTDKSSTRRSTWRNLCNIRWRKSCRML